MLLSVSVHIHSQSKMDIIWWKKQKHIKPLITKFKCFILPDVELFYTSKSFVRNFYL